MGIKPILILVDDDYEPSVEGTTAFDDVKSSMVFSEISALAIEIEYTPAEARSMCQRAIDNLIAMPHAAGQGETCVRVTLDILCKLQKALECVPIEIQNGSFKEVKNDG